MKRAKIWTRLLAGLLAGLMLVSLPVGAFAETVVPPGGVPVVVEGSESSEPETPPESSEPEEPTSPEGESSGNASSGEQPSSGETGSSGTEEENPEDPENPEIPVESQPGASNGLPQGTNALPGNDPLEEVLQAAEAAGFILPTSYHLDKEAMRAHLQEISWVDRIAHAARGEDTGEPDEPWEFAVAFPGLGMLNYLPTNRTICITAPITPARNRLLRAPSATGFWVQGRSIGRWGTTLQFKNQINNSTVNFGPGGVVNISALNVENVDPDRLGEPVYCVEPGIDIEDKSRYNQFNNASENTYWDRAGKLGIADGVYWTIMAAGNHTGDDYRIATQVIIWEMICGLRDSKTGVRNNSRMYDNVQGTATSTTRVKACYNEIAGILEGFLADTPDEVGFEDDPGTIKATANEDGTYTATLPTGGILDINSLNLSAVNAANPGLNATARGNGQNIILTTAKNPSGITFEIHRQNEDQIFAAKDTFYLYVKNTASANKEAQTLARGAEDPKPLYFQITADGKPDIPPPNPPTEGDYQLIINKYEAGTDITLAGAEFEVEYLGGSGEVIVPPVVIDPADPENPDIETPDVPPVVDPEKHFNTTVTTNGNGRATVKLPYAGIYKVTEIVPPAGHKLAENPMQTVTVTDDNASVSVSYHNEPFTRVRITKIDAQTKEPLAGATFHLESVGGGETRQGVSGANGIVEFDNLPAGSYKVTEIAPPLNYHLAKVPIQTVELKANRTMELIFEDEPYTGLKVTKLDAQSKRPLADAFFRLEAVNGEIAQPRTAKSGADGIATFENLPAGSYKVSEITPPPNYHLPPQPVQTIELTPDRVGELIFEDEPYSGFKIRKVDAHDGTGLAGAVFTIHVKDGELVGEYITDVNGLIVKGDLPEGWYTITEQQPPDGYLLDEANKTKDVYIRPEDDVEVVFRDFRKPKLLLEKIDGVTGEKLAGAVFRVKERNGAKYTDVTTGEDGTVLLEGLEANWYTITEIRSPTGYLLDSTPRSVELVMGKTTTITIENSKKSILKIFKTDSVTKQPLQYAVFNIRIKNGLDLGNFTSDANGEVTLEDVVPGLYIIEEITAPDGYLLLTKPTEIQIEPNKAAIIELENTPENPLLIQKVDSKTGEPLAGATFRITKVNGEFVAEETTGRNGFITIGGIDPGFYTVTEVKAPEGYILNSTPQTVELKRGSPAQVEFTNTRLSGLQLQKVDSKTGEPLAGATFRITKVNGEFVAEETTGRNGLITIDGIDPGFYTITEVKAPKGYILNSTPQTVELKRGSPAQVEFTNTRLSGLQLRKVDDVTGEPIAGVRFKLSYPDGGIIGTYTTDGAGLIFIQGLPAGWYVIQELEAPAGYKPDTAPRNIELKENEPNVVEYRNQPWPVLELRKIDSETRKPMAGVSLRLFDQFGRELGTFKTNTLGKVVLSGMDAGKYSVQEVETLPGYELDQTVYPIQLDWGKTTSLELKNQPKSTLRIRKVDAVTGKGVYGATFLLYDSKNNVVGEYTSDQNGIIEFPSELPEGKYKIKEIKAPNGYVLDETVRTVTLKSGETTEIKIANQPERGRIKIEKVSAEYNDYTKYKAGRGLRGAVFVVIDKDHEVVDRMITDRFGMAESKDLPLGIYAVKEVSAPAHYLTNGETFYANIRKHDDVVFFRVENENEDIEVTVKKTGNYEAMPGDVIRYDFSDVANASNVALDSFYLRDKLPTDALRLNEIITGTWSERLEYKVLYKTNYRDWRTLKSGLSTAVNHTLDCRREAVGLNYGEYITEFKFEFGTVQGGFHSVQNPAIRCTVNADLPKDYRFTNCVDVGGERFNEWTIAKDCWTTYTWKKDVKLPKTGF